MAVRRQGIGSLTTEEHRHGRGAQGGGEDGGARGGESSGRPGRGGGDD